MDIKNTSGYPDARVRELVEFAYQSVGPEKIGTVRQVRVRSRTNGYFSGHAWYYHREIVIGVGSSYMFPLKQRHCCKRSKRWPQYCLNDWKETVVCVAAHEFMHLAQYEKEKRIGRHVVKSEIECEYIAKKAIEEYREKETKNVQFNS